MKFDIFLSHNFVPHIFLIFLIFSHNELYKTPFINCHNLFVRGGFAQADFPSFPNSAASNRRSFGTIRELVIRFVLSPEKHLPERERNL